MKYDIYVTQVYAQILINSMKLSIGSKNNRTIFYLSFSILLLLEYFAI